jgi:probable blue pigment (indigoidine) exporter
MKAAASHPAGNATLLLAATVVVWGCTGRVIAVGAPHTEPLTLTTLRAVPAAAVLVAALPFLRCHLPRRSDLWFWTVVSGLLMVTVFLAGFTEAVVRAGPGNAIVLASTAPFFVVMLGWFVTGERISWHVLGGLVIGFGGVTLVVSTQLGGDRDDRDVALGMALAVAAAIGWAAGTFVVKALVVRHPDVDLIGVTAGQYLVGGAALLVLSSSFEGFGGTEWSSGELWLSVAFLAVVGCALATIAYFGALRRLSATTVTAWSFLSPVVGVLLEIALGNMPRGAVMAGMVVTIAGVAIVNAAPELSRV